MEITTRVLPSQTAEGTAKHCQRARLLTCFQGCIDFSMHMFKVKHIFVYFFVCKITPRHLNTFAYVDSCEINPTDLNNLAKISCPNRF